jgi:hypothetical protein
MWYALTELQQKGRRRRSGRREEKINEDRSEKQERNSDPG